MGERANAVATTVKGASPSDLPEAKSDAERTLFAAAALASGDINAAERMLATPAKSDAAPPELLLLYARATAEVRDLDAVHRAERARSIDDKVLEKAPAAWEATLAHAKLAAIRKGASEAKLEALRDLDEQRKKGKTSDNPLLDAFEALAGERALTSGRGARRARKGSRGHRAPSRRRARGRATFA